MHQNHVEGLLKQFARKGEIRLNLNSSFKKMMKGLERSTPFYYIYIYTDDTEKLSLLTRKFFLKSGNRLK